MSNVLVTHGRYDKEFVAANTVGFDEWAKELAEYPPEWAEGVTGIPADTDVYKRQRTSWRTRRSRRPPSGATRSRAARARPT